MKNHNTKSHREQAFIALMNAFDVAEEATVELASSDKAAAAAYAAADKASSRYARAIENARKAHVELETARAVYDAEQDEKAE